MRMRKERKSKTFLKRENFFFPSKQQTKFLQQKLNSTFLRLKTQIFEFTYLIFKLVSFVLVAKNTKLNQQSQQTQFLG